MDPSFIILIVAAFATSVVSAAVGVAGGLMLLAVMSVTLAPAKVVPLHGAVQLFSNGTRMIVFLGQVRWRIFLAYSVALIPGVALAVMLWSGSVLVYLRPVLGVFILLLLLQHRTQPLMHHPPVWLYAGLGLVGGFLAIFVGAVGPFLAPFYLRDDFDNEQTIATQAACQAFTHLCKLPAFLALGYDYTADMALLAALAGAVVVGTLVGKFILGRLSKRLFRIIYKSALALLAVYLIVAGVYLLCNE
jgi:uncharacterized membrane protein YfcA